jgi:catechol 2,3-dioxygenase-like lactoylglutathione lyase family enzyme
MADERTYPCLPCPEIDASITFYESLGFRRTYRQIRPNPYAVVSRDDLQIHLFGIDGFDPAQSYGSAIVAVPDPDALYEAFAAGLRRGYGKLPVAGIPRIGRPRKRYGTVRGFSVVDPGGNWLRVSKLGDAEDDASASKTRTLEHVIDVAARLGDSHDDEPRALHVLITGLARHADATPVQKASAYLYRAELETRLGKLADARASLAAATALPLSASERSQLDKNFAYVTEILAPATQPAATADAADDGIPDVAEQQGDPRAGERGGRQRRL